MTDSKTRGRWRPTRATVIGGILVGAGFALTAINWGFLVISAVGAFGPGILRELGLLHDLDEFQRRAAHRAGYHAYLAGGFVSLLLVALLRSRPDGLEASEEAATVVLVVLWFTWFLSSLLAYWGPRKTATRILIIFGAIWLVFNIIGNLQSPVALVMQCLVAVPFFALAYVARRWPRVAGGLLVVASAFFFYFFRLYRVFGPQPLEVGRPIVIVLFVGPLLASGIALLRASWDGEDTPKQTEEEARRSASV